jgi:sigma-B regulation protein RsbU (phosphoserine phosphatase)
MSKVEPAAGNEAISSLREFLRLQEPVRIEPGAILIHQGEASETAYLLETGSVLVYAETSYGAVSLATVTAPRLIGEIGVLADLPRTASVKVLEPATVLPISKVALLEFGKNAPGVLLSVIGQLGRQISGVNKAISLYTNALSALEKREFDSQILSDLKNPTAELEEFATTFRRFAHQISDKRRQHDEMASAALIQQSLLPNPSALASLSSVLELHADMRPARHVGGDFYDFFMLDEDRLAIAVGDVCGKGIPASLFMAIAVTILRTAAREKKDVAATVERANSILCLENASSMFATVFYAVLNYRTGLLEYCNCGHNHPIIVNSSGELRTLTGSGLPLALFPDRAPPVFSTVLDPENTLLIFTDGVTEAIDVSGSEFGEARLHAAMLASDDLAAQKLVVRLFDAVEEFASGCVISDDITCLAVRRTTAASHRVPSPR